MNNARKTAFTVNYHACNYSSLYNDKYCPTVFRLILMLLFYAVFFRYLPQGLQLICQLCQFTAASWDGLKLHAAGEKHQQQYQLYQVKTPSKLKGYGFNSKIARRVEK